MSFKPCYKWNTFNTGGANCYYAQSDRVLNLVISGIPSIQEIKEGYAVAKAKRFKPCYKWNTFNTKWGQLNPENYVVLNLVISGIPSIPLILIRILILWLVNSLFRG